MTKIKAVIDTNVFVKALIGSPTNEEVYNGFKDGLFELVISKGMLEELIDVFNRAKLGLDLEDIKRSLHLIKRKTTITIPKTKITACRDNSDNIVLEAAVSSKADIIVTNDKDLLVLNPFHNILILSPKEFIKKVKK